MIVRCILLGATIIILLASKKLHSFRRTIFVSTAKAAQQSMLFATPTTASAAHSNRLQPFLFFSPFQTIMPPYTEGLVLCVRVFFVCLCRSALCPWLGFCTKPRHTKRKKCSRLLIIFVRYYQRSTGKAHVCEQQHSHTHTH